MENEVIEDVKGSITKPSQEQAQALSKCMKVEIKAQIILIGSIKEFPHILCSKVGEFKRNL